MPGCVSSYPILAVIVFIIDSGENIFAFAIQFPFKLLNSSGSDRNRRSCSTSPQ